MYNGRNGDEDEYREDEYRVVLRKRFCSRAPFDFEK